MPVLEQEFALSDEGLAGQDAGSMMAAGHKSQGSRPSDVPVGWTVTSRILCTAIHGRVRTPDHAAWSVGSRSGESRVPTSSLFELWATAVEPVARTAGANHESLKSEERH